MEKKIILEQPMEIEKKSFSIIEEHLQGVTLPDAERSILKRVIHTTADFDARKCHVGICNNVSPLL